MLALLFIPVFLTYTQSYNARKPYKHYRGKSKISFEFFE